MMPLFNWSGRSIASAFLQWGGAGAFAAASEDPDTPAGYHVVRLAQRQNPQARDLPPIVAVIQKATISFDFGLLLAPDVELEGVPAVTVFPYDGVDEDAQSRVLSSPRIATVAKAIGGTGRTNAAVNFRIGDTLGGVVYTLVISCEASNGDVLAGWTRIRSIAPT
ncbi:MAG: hypothetical protein A3E01_09955 [Gammaproteobacteria bacterium RIFCSPHIGHO2_12_FULL_63_22]|nr:MAG: hypothetical protein A3E01_09955 [Gammaproteobacteria bacterium RIFCSPHIGHO2_12_FULL_63_22]